jgi:hypothetical protein
MIFLTFVDFRGSLSAPPSGTSRPKSALSG